MGDPLDPSTNIGPAAPPTSATRCCRPSPSPPPTTAVSRARCTTAKAGADTGSGSGGYCPPQIFRVTPKAFPLDGSSSSNPNYGPGLVSGVGCSALCWPSPPSAPGTTTRRALANDSPYGLAHAVFTADQSRADAVAKRLRSGVVWQNCNQPLYPSTPLGCKRAVAQHGELGPRVLPPQDRHRRAPRPQLGLVGS